jgi:hypothetical protein
MLQNFRCNEISWIQFGVHVGRNEYGVKVCLYKIGQPSSLSHGFERFNLYHLTSEPNSIGVRWVAQLVASWAKVKRSWKSKVQVLTRRKLTYNIVIYWQLTIYRWKKKSVIRSLNVENKTWMNCWIIGCSWDKYITDFCV